MSFIYQCVLMNTKRIDDLALYLQLSHLAGLSHCRTTSNRDTTYFRGHVKQYNEWYNKDGLTDNTIMNRNCKWM